MHGMHPQSGRGDKDQPDRLFAGELSGRHIGTLIRFRDYDDTRETVAIVTAELRQLSVNQGHVHLIVGTGADQEHTLEHDALVILRAAEDYSDVAPLLGNDPEYAQFSRR